jgi:hypothetical protein
MSSQPKILLATPMYGGMATGVYVQSLTQLPVMAKEYGVEVSFAFMYNNSLIPHARNQLTDIFLKHDFTHLFFVDADIEFKPSDFLSLIAADKLVIAGVYPQKKINWPGVHQAALNGIPAEQLGERSGLLVVQLVNPKNDQLVPLSEPLEVRGAGTGFMCIKREVFEYLEPHVNKFKETTVEGEGLVREYFFIRNDPETQLQMSEDIAFCWLCRKNGIPVHIAPWVKLKHMGTYLFEGTPVLTEMPK